MRFSDDDYLFTSCAGVRWYVRDNDDGSVSIGAEQDIAPILDDNVAVQNVSDGWSEDKTFRHAARVPYVLIEKWKNEDGIDFYDENCAREVIRRLNSIDYYKLRTARWNI